MLIFPNIRRLCYELLQDELGSHHKSFLLKRVAYIVVHCGGRRALLYKDSICLSPFFNRVTDLEKERKKTKKNALLLVLELFSE